jgi:chemotaxis protein methyltransferase CheR
VLATDIDTQVLAKARSGVYTAEQVSRLSQERLKRFFLKGTGARAGSVKVKPELAATITFEPLNLLAPDWGIREKFDAIFCRNVMIYFDKPTQGRSWNGLHRCSSRTVCCSPGIRRTSRTSRAHSSCAGRPYTS